MTRARAHEKDRTVRLIINRGFEGRASHGLRVSEDIELGSQGSAEITRLDYRQVQRSRVADSFRSSATQISIGNRNVSVCAKFSTKHVRRLFCDWRRAEVEHAKHRKPIRLRLCVTLRYRKEVQNHKQFAHGS